ncbi:MAG: M23 family metallopeptidase [Oscillospiraceae bacterium]|nr:M23 family metallopeptidase [Oscillospiraceae bacterium]
MRRRLLALILALTLLIPAATATAEEDYIKWVDFNLPYNALVTALDHDIQTYGTEAHLDWIALLAVLAAQWGGDFSRYKQKTLDDLAHRLISGEMLEDITSDLKHYDHYLEIYSAVLGEFVGQHRVKVPDPNDPDKFIWEERYGLKVYHPVAEGFGFNHFRDFGTGRSYGYNRRHLGHDLFGAVGTPIVAVESGIVEVMGWNQYGGWRVGIRSFDGLRYYYYAHLRQNRPYHCDLEEGQVVKAGDVIGYMGRTGYSRKENVNGIKETHLHWGMQLIFHPDQEEGPKEIWIDLYNITRLLARNRSTTYRVAETKEFYRSYDFDEPNLFGKLGH